MKLQREVIIKVRRGICVDPMEDKIEHMTDCTISKSGKQGMVPYVFVLGESTSAQVSLSSYETI